MRAGTLPPTGLVSRQQSSPNLNPSQAHTIPQNSSQSNEAERFYQNLSVYRNQDPGMKQQPSPPQPLDDRSVFSIAILDTIRIFSYTQTDTVPTSYIKQIKRH